MDSEVLTGIAAFILSVAILFGLLVISDYSTDGDVLGIFVPEQQHTD